LKQGAATVVKKPKPMTNTVEIESLENAPPSAPDHDQIALLAYLHWQNRGCPAGTPEQDWLKAESELRGTRE